MPAKLGRTPSYRLHRPSGQARVIVNGEHIYLGKYDTPESREKYHRIVAEWLASGRKPTPPAAVPVASVITVNELILAFWQHAQERYP